MPIIRSHPFRALLAAASVLAAVGAWTGGATAAPVQEFLATLAPAQADEFAAWRAAKTRYDQQLDAYWAEIEKKRAGRRAKRGSTKFFDTNDYVWSFPPTYQGPRLSAELDRAWARFLAAQEQSTAQPRQGKERAAGPCRLPRRGA